MPFTILVPVALLGLLLRWLWRRGGRVTGGIAGDLDLVDRLWWDPTTAKKTTVVHGVGDPIQYYGLTTDRDYRWLGWVQGPSMHTRLVAPLCQDVQAGAARPVWLIYGELRALLPRGPTYPQRVLEVGCGRGFCTLRLASLCPDVVFEGIDIVPRHVDVATRAAESAGLSNATFRRHDATVGPLCDDGGGYDLIFGVESLCHLDTSGKRNDFLVAAHDALAPRNGRLVILDAFATRRSRHCDDRPVARALACVHRGFHIHRFPTRQDWCGSSCLVTEEDHLLRPVVPFRSLTHEALPFWLRLARCVRRLARWFPSVVSHAAAGNWGPRWRATADNLLGALFVAHTLEEGVCEYGLLVLGCFDC